MQEIIEKAKAWALEENEKNGTPAREHFEISNIKGQELAKKLNANSDLVMIGTILMDIKLGECMKEYKLAEHTSRGANATQEFLNDFEINQEIKEKIVACVQEHHGANEFTCLESEIVANADCYRFLTPKGIFTYFTLLGKRGKNVNQAMKQVKKKMDEKWNILSLDICKEELEPYYKQFKEFVTISP